LDRPTAWTAPRRATAAKAAATAFIDHKIAPYEETLDE
jgi:hypothetical protein